MNKMLFQQNPTARAKEKKYPTNPATKQANKPAPLTHAKRKGISTLG
jgi:hypothetical protein